VVDSPENSIEILPQEGFLEARFLGAFSVDRFNEQVEKAVRACVEHHVRLLLVDYRRLSEIPTTLERYQIASHGAEAAKVLSRVAALALPAIAA
jgi:hypothetical protein